MHSNSVQIVDSLLSSMENDNSNAIQKSCVQQTSNAPQSAMNQLEQISKMTVIVADTGDLKAIQNFQPRDSTTNPSLVLKALKQLKEEKNDAEYDEYLSSAVQYAKDNTASDATMAEKLCLAVDRIAVLFGCKILKIVPGYVSTELDARLSYNVAESVKRALNIIAMYASLGVENVRDRVLIKVATTWEGIQIARILREEHQIKCNMTLLFSIWQAAAAAQIAGAFLISPFVGRISDWHKKAMNVDGFDAFKDDPGVQSVRNIYGYYRLIGTDTVVMGASFRSKAQVLALAGCDRLTIGPKWLKQMRECNDEITQYLQPKNAETDCKTKLEVSESSFRWNMCLDACATEKLAEGIRKFAADIVRVENLLQERFLDNDGSNSNSSSSDANANAK